MIHSRANFSDLEIEMFFSKYDTTGDGAMDDMEDMFTDMDLDKLDEMDDSDDDEKDGAKQGGFSLGKPPSLGDMAK